jgi:hypothetical protein
MADDQRTSDLGLKEKLGTSREHFEMTDCKLLF